MSQINSILIAVDFRDDNPEICSDTVVFAKKLGAEVTFVYAVDYVPYYPYFPYDEKKVREDFIKEVFGKMNKLKEVFKAEGIEVNEPIVENGKPWEVICSTADRIDACAIVIGIGHHFLFDSLIGSVTERVCHMAKQSVIVINPAKGAKIDGILCSYDFCENSEWSLNKAVEMAEMLKVKLDIIHVVHGDFRLFEKTKPEELQEMADKAAQSIKDLLKAKLGDSDLKVDIHVRMGDTVETVNKFIEENGIDLLFIGASGHGSMKRLFLGSTTEKILKSSKCSIIVSHKTELKASGKAF